MSSTGVKTARAPGKRRGVRAGLCIDVAATSKLLRSRRLCLTYGEPAVIAVAGMLEYLANRVVEPAARISTDKGKKTILGSHVVQAMEQDPELAAIVAAQTGGGRVFKLTKVYPKDKTKDSLPVKKRAAAKSKGKGKGKKGAKDSAAAEPAAESEAPAAVAQAAS